MGNIDLSDEEKEFLLKLTEEPTSVSADLAPPKTSFITPGLPQVPSTVSPIIPKDLAPQSTKRLLKLPTTLGLGFDPTAIEPGNETCQKIAKFRNVSLQLWHFFFSESGFKPIVEGQGGSIPTLAFSVNDGAERPPVTADLYHQDFLQRRQDLLDDFVVNQLAQVNIINYIVQKDIVFNFAINP